MRKNYVLKLGALALAVSLITTGMMGTTLARYADEAVGTGTVAIAKWNVKLQDASKNPVEELGSTFSFNLADTKKNNDNAVSSVVAPGDEGVIKYVIHDNGGTQVDYKAKVTLDTSGLTSTGGVIKFYSDDTYAAGKEWKNVEITVDSGKDGTSAKEIAGNIYWKWVPDDNVADTTIGTSTGNETFTVTLSAEQILPTDTPPSP